MKHTFWANLFLGSEENAFSMSWRTFSGIPPAIILDWDCKLILDRTSKFLLKISQRKFKACKFNLFVIIIVHLYYHSTLCNKVNYPKAFHI